MKIYLGMDVDFQVKAFLQDRHGQPVKITEDQWRIITGSQGMKVGECIELEIQPQRVTVKI